MADTVNDIKQEAWSHFEDYQYVMLATTEGSQPRVRPVTLINFDKTFWIGTGTNSAKVKQIRNNSNIEFCLQFERDSGNGYVRVVGIANIVTDKKTKARLANHIDFFNNYWEGVDDPTYTLIQITPVEIEYRRSSEMAVQRFKV